MIPRRGPARPRPRRERALADLLAPTPRRRTRTLTRAATRMAGIGLVVGLLAPLAAHQPAQLDDPGGSRRSVVASLSAARPAADAGASVSLVSYATAGQVITRVIPGGTSAFRARRALIYLPPVLQQSPQTRLPVLMLLHGTPGGPTDWVRKGALLTTMNAFAAAHGGLAPIVVMPDVNGSVRADTECVHSPRGNIEDYLARVVPEYVQAHLPVAAPGRQWAVAGLSEGATCSLMLALRHPSVFSTVGFFSGLTRPTVGRTDNPAATIARLFGGSRARYDRHDPLWLMRHATYPSQAVWLESGALDRQCRAAAAAVAAAARNAGVSTVVRTTPGRHQWRVWQTSLRQSLPWMWGRIGQ